MLSFFARMFLLRRLFGQRPPHRRGYGHRGSGHRSSGHRGRGGFGMTGPFPTYSRRTRGGSQVKVGGCCLPIPLALSLSLLGLGRLAMRRR